MSDQYDLVVVGGGMSGFCTAVSAAGAGLRVALVQDRPVLGGSGSSEIRVPVSGAASSNAWAAETGLIHRIALLDRQSNPTPARPTTVHLDLVLDDIAEQTDGLTVYRSTVVHGVSTAPGSDGRVHLTEVRGRQLGSERDVVLTAPQFVDATGDGTLSALAGMRWSYGREARHEYGESLAPVVSDESSLGSTITMQARRMDRPVPFTAPSWAIDYRSTDLTFDRSLPKVIGDIVAGFWWVEVNDPFHQIDDNQAIRRQLHRHVLGLWDFLKNASDKSDQLSHHHLEWIGQVPGKRESRRVRGEVVIRQADVVEDQRWCDEVGYAGWWIDLHSKGALENLDAPAERENIDRYYRGLARVAPFSVPLRACCAADADNLWLVGRCLSATHVGLGPIRVQQTLAQLGQAVGLAAAGAHRARVDPRTMATDPAMIGELQQELLRNDVRLLNVAHGDTNDLARRAQVVAPAADFAIPEAVSDWQSLDVARGQVIPALGSNTARRVAVRLRQSGDREGRVRVWVEPMTTIWDRAPGTPRRLGLISVPAGSDGWFEAPLPIEPSGIQDDRPVRVWLEADDEPGASVEWAQSAQPPTGALIQQRLEAPGGPEPANAELACFAPEEIEIPPYTVWQQIRRLNHLVRLTPPATPYRAENVANDWAWPGRGANLWISPPQLPATIELQWDRPHRVGAVDLSFDTDLDTATDSRPGLHIAPECVRDFHVDVHTDDGWTTVAQSAGNHLRHCRLTFPTVAGDALRVVVTATNGAAEARIYQLRVTGPDTA